MAPTVYMLGVGAALPERRLTNEQIEAGMPWLQVGADWVREHTGIRERRVVAPGEQAIDLGHRAAVQAIAAAGSELEGIDLVLLATNTAQLVYPAGAALIQQKLAGGTTGKVMARAAALDLQQGCASFVAGIILATGMIRSGACQRALVVGADVATRMVDWTDKSSVLLGDGAAACVLSNHLPEVSASGLPRLQILGSFMRTIPDRESISQGGVLDDHNDPFEHMAFAAGIEPPVTKPKLYARLLRPPWADQHFRMDGRKVFRFVRRTVACSGYAEVLHRAGVVDADEASQLDRILGGAPSGDAADAEWVAAIGSRIDRFIPHGANMVLDQELADQLHIPYERMALTLPMHGNTSAASVGIALEHNLRAPTCYSTIAKRDADGRLTKPARAVEVPALGVGQTVLLLAFGAGCSWNYVAARTV